MNILCLYQELTPCQGVYCPECPIYKEFMEKVGKYAMPPHPRAIASIIGAEHHELGAFHQN